MKPLSSYAVILERKDGSFFTTSYPQSVNPNELSEDGKKALANVLAKLASDSMRLQKSGIPRGTIEAATKPNLTAGWSAAIEQLYGSESVEGLRKAAVDAKMGALVNSRDAIIRHELRVMLAKAEYENASDIEQVLEVLRDNHRRTYNEDVRLSITVETTKVG